MYSPLNPKFSFFPLLVSLVAIACSGSEGATPCERSDDCFAGEVCHRDQCIRRDAELNPNADPAEGTTGTSDVALPPGPAGSGDVSELDMSPDTSVQRPWKEGDPHYTQGEALDAGAETDQEDEPSHEPDMPPCDGITPVLGELILNEVLMNVPLGEEGDANADGTRDAFDDEFIEMVNVSQIALDLHGVEVLVNEHMRHTFEDECLQPGQSVVLFSGPRGRVATWREDVLFMGSESKLGLSNTAGKVELWDGHERVLFSFSYESAQRTSYLLWPELTGRVLVPHSSVTEELFSPGRCANRAALSTGCEP